MLALWVHKSHGDYTSVGASGAVNGVVYAAIALLPSMGIGLFLLPISIPAWAFGLIYVVFTIYGIKAKWGNVNHAAHLGGALAGILLTAALYPDAVIENYLPILAITLPTIAFLVLIIYKPNVLLTGLSAKQKPFGSIDHQYNYRRAQEQASVDSILEKIHRRGMNSLTKQEKETLERYSKLKR